MARTQINHSTDQLYQIDIRELVTDTPTNNDWFVFEPETGNTINKSSGNDIADALLVMNQSYGTESASSYSAVFDAGIRGYKQVDCDTDCAISLIINNKGENYILINNTGSSDIDITIAGVSFAGTALASTAIKTPTNGITVPAGEYVEIGVYANSSIAVITAGQNLS